MFEKELLQRRITLEKIIAKITKELPEFPQGNLRIQKCHNTTQYFLVTDKQDTHGKYIQVNDHEMVAQLARKNYYEKLLKETLREQKTIDSYLKGMNGKNPEEVFSAMNPYRKALIEPLLLSDAEYAKNWESLPYEKSAYYHEECIHPTEKGDLVRSKTEARIADMYYALGIPYRYEAPLILKSGKVKYPDFTLLKLPERTLIYHEHMGIMDDDGYRRNNIIKLQEYSESKIFTGVNLILTFETEYAPLNLKDLRDNVKNLFFSS